MPGEISRLKSPDTSFKSYDTICRQVANRVEHLVEFAKKHEVVLFVAGAKSSNGKILYNNCLSVNPRTYLISNESHIQEEWLRDAASIGICGATSTPRWLMEKVRDRVEEIIHQ